jgi:hypothetical protein
MVPMHCAHSEPTKTPEETRLLIVATPSMTYPLLADVDSSASAVEPNAGYFVNCQRVASRVGMWASIVSKFGLTVASRIGSVHCLVLSSATVVNVVARFVTVSRCLSIRLSSIIAL